MQITLNDKTYTVDKIKARMIRRSLEITNEVNFNNLKPVDLDKMVEFTVELFEKQFTVDEVWDGLGAAEFQSIIIGNIETIIGTMGAKLEQMPKNE